MSPSTSAAIARRRVVKQRVRLGPAAQRAPFGCICDKLGCRVSSRSPHSSAASCRTSPTSGFWAEHALLTSIVASVLVVLVSVAVINEVIEQRRRKRWRVLAQYVMFELVRNARMFWLGVLEEAGRAPPPMPRRASSSTRRDRSFVTRPGSPWPFAPWSVTLTPRSLASRHRLSSPRTPTRCSVNGRAVMLNAELYAEIIDRHVELAGIIVWISDLLDIKSSAR